MYLETYIYLTILLLGSVIGMLRWKHLSTPFKLVGALIAITFLEESFIHFSDVTADTTPHIYRAYTLTAFSLYYLSYYFISKIKILKIVSLLSIGLLVILSILGIFTFESSASFPSTQIFVASSFLILCTMLGFYQMLLFPNQERLKKSSLFLYISFNLIYWTVSLVYIGAFDTMIRLNIEIGPFTDVHSILGILYYLGLAYVLYLDRYYPSTSIPARL